MKDQGKAGRNCESRTCDTSRHMRLAMKAAVLTNK